MPGTLPTRYDNFAHMIDQRENLCRGLAGPVAFRHAPITPEETPPNRLSADG
jgi:hypothetical protein